MTTPGGGLKKRSAGSAPSKAKMGGGYKKRRKISKRKNG